VYDKGLSPEFSSGMNLRTNFLQEKEYYRGLSTDSIQEKLQEEPLQFKGHEDIKIMTQTQL